MALFRMGKELGLKDAHKYAFLACPVCSKERWVRWANRTKWTGDSPLCNDCRSHLLNYKGGRNRAGKNQEYIDILLRPDDFFFPMTRSSKKSNVGGYVMEHRLVMAKHLGRCLHSWELVHHKNHIKDDNRIENLQLIGSDKHNALTLLETRIIKLENKVEMQSKQIKLLKWQLRESQKGVQHRFIQ